MDVNVVPNFQPSPDAYAPAVQAYHLMLDHLRAWHQQGRRRRRLHPLIGGLVNSSSPTTPAASVAPPDPPVISMFADDLGLP